jgi:hypothetical protein
MEKIILSNKLMHYIAKAGEIVEKMALKQSIRERRIKKIPQVKL